MARRFPPRPRKPGYPAETMVHICIPCRDEDRTIGVLLWKIREVMLGMERDFHVYVLNDGSGDETRAQLEKYRQVLPLTILSEEQPVGYGRALEKLFRTAAGATRYPKRDAIVTMQADFTEHPAGLRALVRTFEGGADIVACKSGEESANQPWTVRLARRLGRIALGRPAPEDPGIDPLLGFRAYRAVVVRKALRAAAGRPLITTDGWAANAELMKVLAPFARRVAHVPLGLRYDIRWRGTRVRVLGTVRQILRVRRVSQLEAEGHGAA
ncbi:MAG: glycosyltransferase family 2 protein [Gemmatimonadetes bacterium]|nr:glycosyltransferase family 2 protein [Gemmatimonadota bacterium]